MTASSAVKEILSVEEFQQFLNSAGPTQVVALNFWAPWAAPCQQMNQVFAELSLKHPSVAFGQVRHSIGNFINSQIEAEQLADVAETFEVTAVPFFVLVKNSKILTRISGANPPSLTTALQLHTSTSALPPAQETLAPAAPITDSTSTTEPSTEDLNERLAKLVKAAPVMLFMKGTPSAPQCGFSRTLVGILREKNVRYGFFNILADDDVRQGLKTFSDWPTYPSFPDMANLSFPQLYIDGEFVGGLDIVKEMVDNGEFEELVQTNGQAAESA
jgi:Grx4 family monothiol glutaredoxin